MSELTRGIILEGISCSGKTSTMYAIKKLFACDHTLERNVIMLGEHYTQALNMVHGNLKHHDKSEHTKMLNQRVNMIEELNQWAVSLGDYRRTSRGLYTIFERGIINHIAYYNDYDNPEIIDMARRLSTLGIESVVLIISEKNIEERIKQRDQQMGIVNKLSYYKNEVVKAINDQNIMLESLSKIPLSSRIINTDFMDWDGYAKMILST